MQSWDAPCGEEPRMGSGGKPGKTGHRPFPACRSSRPPSAPHVSIRPSVDPDETAWPCGIGEISRRAHLDQTRGRALELVRLETFVGVIERVGLCLGGGHELDRIVVKGIDQNDEAFGLVAPL